MLVVITLIGVIAMNSSHLEWLMTNNSQFQSGAYRNATIALAAGLTNATDAPPSAIDSFFPVDLSNVSNWKDDGPFPISHPAPPTICTSTCGYYVQYLGCSVFTEGMIPSSSDSCDSLDDLSVHSYRVWAYGSDGKGAARILQLTIRRIYNPKSLSGPMKGPVPNNWMEIS